MARLILNLVFVSPVFLLLIAIGCGESKPANDQGSGLPDSKITLKDTPDDENESENKSAKNGKPNEKVAADSPGDENSDKNEDPEFIKLLARKKWSLQRTQFANRNWLMLETRGELTQEEFETIGRSRQLEFINLGSTKVTDENLEAISNLSGLQGIWIASDVVTNAGIQHLGKLSKLEYFSLIGSEKVNDDGIAALGKIPTLKKINLISVPISGKCFELFPDDSPLFKVAITNSSELTDEGLMLLTRFDYLDVLEISLSYSNSQVTTAGVQKMIEKRLPKHFEIDDSILNTELFSKLVEKGWLFAPGHHTAESLKPKSAEDLVQFSFSNCPIGDGGFEKILGCKKIQHFWVPNTGLTDATLERMSDFKKLDCVNISQNKITGQGLEAIASAPITELYLDGVKLDEAAFKAIAKMKKLESIQFDVAQFDPAHVRHLAEIKSLRKLRFRKTAFDDQAVKSLKSLPKLETLEISSTNITDQALTVLAEYASLNTVEMHDTRLTKEAYEEFKRKHPKIDVSNYELDR